MTQLSLSQLAGTAERNGRTIQTTLKIRGDGTDVPWRDSSFQTRAAATGKAQSPTVDNRVRRTIGDDEKMSEDKFDVRGPKTREIHSLATMAPFHANS